MCQVALIITTFLRDELLFETLQNLDKYRPDNSIILVGDQGKFAEQKKKNYEKVIKDLYYYELPFDCGLSYARNFLVSKASEKQIPYCLMMADSIRFKRKEDLSGLYRLLESQPTLALVSFDESGRKCPWEYKMQLTKQGFVLEYSTEVFTYEGVEYLVVDLCNNTFLGKTDVLIQRPWDNDLKIAEHEVFFWNLKTSGYKCLWTNKIQTFHVACQPEDYRVYRARLGKYLSIVREKMGISGWVIYPKTPYPKTWKGINPYPSK